MVCVPELTILIIENDVSTAELYHRELSRFYHVITCDNEITAMQSIEARDPSAIILEPAGLGEQGWDFLKRIKSLEKMKSIPIIVCSTLDERRKGLQLGATTFLLKPILPSTLLQALHQVTASKAAAAEPTDVEG